MVRVGRCGAPFSQGYLGGVEKGGYDKGGLLVRGGVVRLGC